MKKKQLCNGNEFLLFVDQFDCQFTHEAEMRPMSVEEAASEVEDTTLRIIRMDRTNWHGEDVSEEVAVKWLDYLDDHEEASASDPNAEHRLTVELGVGA